MLSSKTFKIQTSKIKTFLIDFQLEECSQYFLKILVNLNLIIPIKKGSYKGKKKKGVYLASLMSTVPIKGVGKLVA